MVFPAIPPSRYFPPADQASQEGIVLIGGRLTPAWLLDAYCHGIFPWPIFGERDPMAWWSPDPRGILELESLHVSRRLRRTIRSRLFQITCDRDFAGVLHGCAQSNGRPQNAWLTRRMIRAYQKLHELGHAHSVEAWQGGQLAGGVYGVAIAGLFSAESMFYSVRDASKVALVSLVAHLRARGYPLLDIQQLTEHTARFGGVEISRREYLQRLAAALQAPVTFGAQLEAGTS
jgi:leucyl/phenylalanyl-tRNA--protein transferase